MSGGMGQADLVQDLKGLLGDAAGKFTTSGSADFVRHLDMAARDLGRVRPRTLLGSIALEAGESVYPAPADILRPKVPLWGLDERRTYKPWQKQFPAHLPKMTLVEGAGGLEIHLSPAPTADQIAALGSTFRFYYFARHIVGRSATETTVQPGDRHLLLVRAAAFALMELAASGISKPVQLGPGVGAMPKNGTPGALATQLLEQFTEMAA